MQKHLQNFKEKVFVNQEFCSMSNYLSYLKPNRKTFSLNKKICHLVHFLKKKKLKTIFISGCEGVVCIRVTLVLKNCES